MRLELVSGGGSGRCGGDALHEAALAASGLVLVDDSGAGGTVDALDGKAGEFGGVLAAFLSRSEGAFGAGLHLGAHGLVGETKTLVLAIALDLALDVGHWCTFLT
jgi:hypothetical protein